jgi:hypothetical protein
MRRLRNSISAFALYTLMWNSAALAQGLPATTMTWPAGKTTMTIPFNYDTGLIVIPVSVMGSKTLQMILDTGSPLIVLPDESLAKTMDLNIVTQVPVGGTGDGELQTVPLAMGVNATVGGLSISNVNLIVGAAKEVLSEFDGVIGASIFQNCVVEFNWEEREIYLHEPGAYEYSGAGVVLDLVVAPDGHPYVDGFSARLQDSWLTDLKLHLDSGYRGSLTLYTDSHDGITVPDGAQESIIAWGSRGAERGFLSKIDALKIGNTELTGLSTSFKEVSEVKAGTPKHHGSMGLFVLERFHTIIDYPGGRLILDPTEGADRPFATNTIGIQTKPRNSGIPGLTIVNIVANSPATKSGVQPGDSVMMINGTSVSEMNFGEISGAWSSAPGSVLQLTLERGGSVLELSLTAASFQ